MKLLLDTHTLLWSLMNPKELDPIVTEKIISPENLIYVSIASIWELQIKESIGKITLPKNFFDTLEPSGFELLPVFLDHIKELRRLPLLHRDPFDRILIAQAQSEDLILVTRDDQILKYEGNFLKV
jgi:PIN domain nuclease of toxin-antitoxin system